MPKWLNNAVFYEIYPQSFYDTNGDGIGDLPGITAKLDYIHQLGCNALWINPCFDSPFYDAGYDVRDYCRIAPRYGTNEDARQLFREAHTRGIRVLLDLVAGHTSLEHPWFLESKKREPNAYSGRYIWSDNVWERFEGISGITGAIAGFCDRASCAVNFYSTQPALNYGFASPNKGWQSSVDSPEATATREALLDVMRFWLDMGCDGFRVDMAHSLVKDDPEQVETIKLWQKIRRVLDGEYPQAALISEWGDPKRSLEAGFHMDFLLHFGASKYMSLFREEPFFSRSGKGCIAGFVENYLDMYQSKPEEGLICIPSSNHDMPRISQHLSQEELKLAFVFLLTMPGAPFLYYGDEIGMRYLEGLPSVEGGYERTGSRSPMQWDSSLNAGFSSGRRQDLYIPLDPDPGRPNVAEQWKNPHSLLREVRQLIGLRLEQEALQSRAPITFLRAEERSCPFAYRRGEGEEAVTVLLNPWQEAATFALDTGGKAPLYLLGEPPMQEGETLRLAPASAVMYKGSFSGPKRG